MEYATMTSKSQITGPSTVRDALGQVPGDTIHFVPGRRGYRLVVLDGDIRSISDVRKGRRKKPVSIAAMNPSISWMGSLSGEQTAAETQRRTRRD